MLNLIDEIDVYYTVNETVKSSIKIKSSEFIATVMHVSSIDDVSNNLNSIRTEYFDAAHNCFAYRIGCGGNIYRFSDDGEPSGSAGKPILFEIEKYKLSDILVVVTRYFGGTKLGVGGLVRAYSESAETSLKLCKPIPVYLTDTFEIIIDYDEISLLKRLVADFVISVEEIYTDKVKFIMKVVKSRSNVFSDFIFTSTNGKVLPKKLNKGL